MGEISTTETMLFIDAPSRARRVVRHGDVLISTVRTYLKAIAPVKNPPENFIASTGFAVVRHGSDAAPGYLAYALRTDGFVGEVISRSVGVSYPAINSRDLMNITIPAPPPD
jgi:type I restriction enzyme S subunit